MDNLTNQEITKLQSTKNGDEWNSVCDEVKAARGGEYPGDWNDIVVVSGVALAQQMKWAAA